MLDLKYVIANLDAVRENCRNRAVPADVLEDLDRIADLEADRRRVLSTVEDVRRRQNEVAQSTGKEKDPARRAELIEAAVEEDVPGDWGVIWRRFRAVVDAIPRRAAIADLEPIVADLAAIREEIDILLNSHMNVENPDANESHNGWQQSDSNTNARIESEPALEQSRAAAELRPGPQEPLKAYPLGLVLKACPDIIDYALDGIGSWRDLMMVAAQVRGYLGISPSAYEDACHIMGQECAAIVVACILQRAQHINSAGGYLRALTEKARAGEFTVGPMLMAALKANRPSSDRRAG